MLQKPSNIVCSVYRNPIILISILFWQDYFWTFCCQLWKSKEITEGNILAESHAGAKKYIDSLREKGLLAEK